MRPPKPARRDGGRQLFVDPEEDLTCICNLTITFKELVECIVLNVVSQKMTSVYDFLKHLTKGCQETEVKFWGFSEMVSPITALMQLRLLLFAYGMPIKNVKLETHPQREQVVEGKKLVLICSVDKGTGDITFSFYKGAGSIHLETKTRHSLKAEFEIPMMKESDAELYYCIADNGFGPSVSELVNITVRVPVSRPVLTFGTLRDRATVGDTLVLHCETRKGSPPILYWFYHEDVSLGNRSAPAGGRVSFNFSLMAEHSGNYSCEAENGLGAQHSEVVTLNVTVPTEYKGDPLPSEIIEGLLGIIGFTILALLFFYWIKRKIGRRTAGDTLRSPSHPVLQDSAYVNSPDPSQLEPVYVNENVARGNEVYSLVYQVQQGQQLETADCEYHCTFVRLAFDLEFEQTLVLMLMWPTANHSHSSHMILLELMLLPTIFEHSDIFPVSVLTWGASPELILCHLLLANKPERPPSTKTDDLATNSESENSSTIDTPVPQTGSQRDKLMLAIQVQGTVK
ncbi:Fc receptor-like protein 1 [Suncus etruscus]|uniref:Fc receptor-like protein 1 n=1 Tax=Suncus etruscus TaxID=109475 RepID=UPI0021106808|nr:Fc receptor-like protein 1 [Suncus etruscus]